MARVCRNCRNQNTDDPEPLRLCRKCLELVCPSCAHLHDDAMWVVRSRPTYPLMHNPDGTLMDLRPELELRRKFAGIQEQLLTQLQYMMRRRGAYNPEARIRSLWDAIECNDLPFTEHFRDHLRAVSKVCNWSRHEMHIDSQAIDLPHLVYCECPPVDDNTKVPYGKKHYGMLLRRRACQRAVFQANLDLWEQYQYKCPEVFPGRAIISENDEPPCTVESDNESIEGEMNFSHGSRLRPKVKACPQGNVLPHPQSE